MAQLSASVTNAGPDAATGVGISLGPTLVSISGAAPRQGTLSANTWDVGTVASGAQASMVVTPAAATAGAASFTAEVSAADVVDPDSKPGNGVATEDDRAQVAMTVPAPAATSPAATPPAAPPTLRLTGLSLVRTTFRARGLQGTRTVGTTIRFTLTTKATITVTIEKRVGRTFRKAGTLRFTAPAGRVSRAFSGRIGTKPLSTGSYRMRIRAVAGTTAVNSKPLPFTIATR